MTCIKQRGIDLASEIAYVIFTFPGIRVGKAVRVFIQFYAASPHKNRNLLPFQ